MLLKHMKYIAQSRETLHSGTQSQETLRSGANRTEVVILEVELDKFQEM